MTPGTSYEEAARPVLWRGAGRLLSTGAGLPQTDGRESRFSGGGGI